MSSTDSIQTRDKERTRTTILDTAARLYHERGNAVTIAAIAEESGVSKSGLIHHYPSRGDLERAIVEHLGERLWADVRDLVDLSENHSGKLLRAYIRAMTGESQAAAYSYGPSSIYYLMTMTNPEDQLWREDAQRWREAFAADGLPAGLTLTLRLAAEGAASLADTPYLTPEELTALRQSLLTLTEAP